MSMPSGVGAKLPQLETESGESSSSLRLRLLPIVGGGRWKDEEAVSMAWCEDGGTAGEVGIGLGV